MTHQETRVEEVKKVLVNEDKEPLYIKEETVNPKAIIINHNLISNDAPFAPKYISTQGKSILHFEDTFHMFGTESLQAC